MLFKQVLTTTTRTVRSYSTATNKSKGSFYYQYGTPLVKCAVIASATTMAFQLLWQHLEYQEYRDDADAYVAKLEDRLKTLEEQQR
ncbi:hypothetical protein BDF21DRAFT_425513 [Thamnidium elegans]|uniref:Uncharacterized protein n=1 Tax=Thamnidium elegans TaxID=101142 RepID=A0A8H7SVD8_9FUNG|nr:hypothetical protein INT48_004267 [Thamnidium elegans]KAI8068784.1 hypothetical protein BDF21DRAFT_425513 [Thamnidium elegans]